MNEMDLQTYSVAISNAKLNILDAANLITQAMSDAATEDVTLLMRAHGKMNTAWRQLRDLSSNMTNDFCDDNPDFDLRSHIESHTDARGHKHVAHLREHKSLDAQDAIDGLNEAWSAMREEIRATFDKFDSVVQSMHDKEGS